MSPSSAARGAGTKNCIPAPAAGAVTPPNPPIGVALGTNALTFAAGAVVGAVVKPSLAKTSTYRERSPAVARGDPTVGGPASDPETDAAALGEPSLESSRATTAPVDAIGAMGGAPSGVPAAFDSDAGALPSTHVCVFSSK